MKKELRKLIEACSGLSPGTKVGHKEWEQIRDAVRAGMAALKAEDQAAKFKEEPSEPVGPYPIVNWQRITSEEPAIKFSGGHGSAPNSVMSALLPKLYPKPRNGKEDQIRLVNDDLGQSKTCNHTWAAACRNFGEVVCSCIKCGEKHDNLRKP